MSKETKEHSLIASMASFSTAMTLFGVEQLEKTLSVVGGNGELSKTVEEFEKTLDSLTNVLTGKMDEKKKDTLKSVTKMAEDTVGRAIDTMEVMDPREVLKAGTDMLQKTSDVTAEWASRTASAVEKVAGKSEDSKASKSQ
jgi:hypothetical protein